MTEMTEVSEIVPSFAPVAFTAALIAAPVLVTLVTGVFLIPIAALILGGPVYLIAGTPVLLWMVGRFPPDFETYALGGLLTNLALLAVASLLLLPTPDAAPAEALWFLLPGVIFAPIWAGTFGYLYARFTRSNPT